MQSGPDELVPAQGIRLNDEQKIAWLRLIRSENVGPATFFDAINHFGTAAEALEGLPQLVSRGKSGKSIRVASQQRAEEELERLIRINGRLICFGEPDYPPALRAADAPPAGSSCVAGSSEVLTRNAVAIVGSRNASLAGVKLTRTLAKGVAEAGYTIVSGLARGIDSAAHEASLDAGTVAVFAGGHGRVIYPPRKRGACPTRLSTRAVRS